MFHKKELKTCNTHVVAFPRKIYDMDGHKPE